MAQEHRKTFVLALLVAGGCCAVLAGVVQCEFVDFDDQIHVFENPRMLRPSFKALGEYWTAPYEDLYIPVTYTVWTAAAVVSRMPDAPKGAPPFHAWVFHTINLVVHGASVALVLVLLRLLTGGVRGPVVGALLFGLHPLQIESVAWVSELKGLLATAFGLAALTLYVSALRRPDGGESAGQADTKPPLDRWFAWRYAAATLCLALALLSKPSMVTFPPIALVLSWVWLGRPFRRSLLEAAPWFAMALVFVRVATGAQTALLPEEPSISQRGLVAGDALTFYLTKLVWPTALCVDYGRTPQAALGDLWIPFRAVAGPLALLALALAWRRRPVVAGLGVLVLAVAPVLGFMPFRFQNTSTVADRYMYFPMLGAALAAGWAVGSLRTRLAPALAGAVLALLAWLSFVQVEVWRTPASLLENALRVNPASAVAHLGLFTVEGRRGNTRSAVSHAVRRLQLERGADEDFETAEWLARHGFTREAIEGFRGILRANPGMATARCELGRLLIEAGRPGEAEQQLRLALPAPSRKLAFIIHTELGRISQMQGRSDEALDEFRAAAAAMPELDLARYNLGTALLQAGRADEAVSALAEAVRLNPTAPGSHAALGQALEAAGRKDEARVEYQTALRLDPRNPAAREALRRLGESPAPPSR